MGRDQVRASYAEESKAFDAQMLDCKEQLDEWDEWATNATARFQAELNQLRASATEERNALQAQVLDLQVGVANCSAEKDASREQLQLSSAAQAREDNVSDIIP